MPGNRLILNILACYLNVLPFAISLKIKYEEKLEFLTPKGKFFFPLCALLPKISIHIPENIHFGLSAVDEIAELHFKIHNTRFVLNTKLDSIKEVMNYFNPSKKLLDVSLKTIENIFFLNFKGTLSAKYLYTVTNY